MLEHGSLAKTTDAGGVGRGKKDREGKEKRGGKAIKYSKGRIDIRGQER